MIPVEILGVLLTAIIAMEVWQLKQLASLDKRLSILEDRQERNHPNT